MISVLLIQGACVDQPENKINILKKFPSAYKKPVSTYQDSLEINSKAVVFCQPDSLQLIKIKAMIDSAVYDGIMHEIFYQIRNARNDLKKNWPLIKIIEAKNYRYLIFNAIDGRRDIIDLDTINNAYELFIFDQKNPPEPVVEMTNIEPELVLYFNKK